MDNHATAIHTVARTGCLPVQVHSPRHIPVLSTGVCVCVCMCAHMYVRARMCGVCVRICMCVRVCVHVYGKPIVPKDLNKTGRK
jgi:hypothetical protein